MFQHAGDGRRRARVLRRADQNAAQVPPSLVGDELEPEFAAKRQPLSRIPAANAQGQHDFTLNSIMYSNDNSASCHLSSILSILKHFVRIISTYDMTESHTHIHMMSN